MGPGEDLNGALMGGPGEDLDDSPFLDLPSHAAILAARSNYFRTRLCGDSRDWQVPGLKGGKGARGILVVPDVDHKALRSTLSYMYSGRYEMPTQEADLAELFVLASRFGLPGLLAAIICPYMVIITN